MPWLLILRSPWTWVGLAMLGLGAWGGLQSLRLRECKADFAQFRADTERLGAEAKVRNAQEAQANLEREEKANAENKATHAADAATIAQLRNANPGRSRLPKAPATSSRPDLACFDRTEYQRADGVTTETLFAGARGLADEGTAATIDLNTAKKWAQP